MKITLSGLERTAANTAIDVALNQMKNMPVDNYLNSARIKVKHRKADYSRDEIISLVGATGTVAAMIRDSGNSEFLEHAAVLETLSEKFKSFL
jgi:hypothetical protein